MTKDQYIAVQYVLMDAIFGGSDNDKLKDAINVTESFLLDVKVDSGIYEESFSNCCGAAIIENTDLCSDCQEHCEIIEGE